MLQHTTKESPQGIKIEYVEPTSGVQATDKELGRIRRELALDRERRNRGVTRIEKLKGE
jgi:hypothetical protein